MVQGECGGGGSLPGWLATHFHLHAQVSLRQTTWEMVPSLFQNAYNYIIRAYSAPKYDTIFN